MLNLTEQYKERAKKNKATLFSSHRFAVDQFSAQEQTDLMELYDVSIEDIALPSPSQQWFFSEQDFVSPQFYVQSLFRISGIIVPDILMSTAKQLIRTHSILRTAFYFGEARTLAVVLKGRSPEFIYRDLENVAPEKLNETLENLLDADRRRGFALDTDRLLRIGLYKTGNRDYAVMIAQPQVIADSWDLSELFNPIFDTDDAIITADGRKDIQLLREKNLTFAQYLQQRTKQDKAPALRYWGNLLKNLPLAPQVPGYQDSFIPYEQAIETMEIDSELTAKCQTITRGEKSRLAILLQTTWGIMLQAYNHANDTCFFSILSNRNDRLENMNEAANLINIMPVRLHGDDSLPICDILHKQYLQNIVSEPMNYCDYTALLQMHGKNSELFNHYLNFHNFFSHVSTYHKMERFFGVMLVMVNSFDDQIKNLGVYFRFNEENFKIEYVYNRHCFQDNRIGLLKSNFLAALRLIAENSTESMGNIRKSLCDQYMRSQNNANLGKYNQSEIAHFIKDLPWFSALSEESIAKIAYVSCIRKCIESDVIIAEGQKQKNIFFVMRGKVEISRSLRSGWQGSVGILGMKSMINCDGILDVPSNIRAEALANETLILEIPRKTICTLLETENSIMYLWIHKMAEEISKYQKLWLNE